MSPLEQITAALEEQKRANRGVVDAVREARDSGRSWAEIARHLGITRQAAWERYTAAMAPGEDR